MKSNAFGAVIRNLLQCMRNIRLKRRFIGLIFVMFALIGLLLLNLNAAQPALASTNCVPNKDYTLPTALSFTSAPNGLSVADDGIETYGISGNTIANVRSALSSCAPSFMGSEKSGEYLAYTSYTLDWQYTVASHDGVTCTLSSAKVGLHLSQLQPELLSSVPNPLIATKWKAFSHALQQHENGHKTLDVQYATKLSDSLTDLRAPCDSIHIRITDLTTQTIKNMNTANAHHDDLTNYGRSEGAIW